MRSCADFRWNLVDGFYFISWLLPCTMVLRFVRFQSSIRISNLFELIGERNQTRLRLRRILKTSDYDRTASETFKSGNLNKWTLIRDMN